MSDRDDYQYFIEKLKTELEGTGKYLKEKEDVLKSPDLPPARVKEKCVHRLNQNLRL